MLLMLQLNCTATTHTTYPSDKRRGNDGQGKRHPPVYQKPRSTLPVIHVKRQISQDELCRHSNNGAYKINKPIHVSAMC